MIAPRVIFLSSGTMGSELLTWLQGQPCNLVLTEANNKRITEFPPYDLGLAIFYTHKVPPSEFDRPKRWVNFHPGPLPEFRGRNIAYHAIVENAQLFGATVHYMDAQFDTGEIIEVVRFPIEPWDTAGDLVSESHRQLVRLFKKYVPSLLVSPVASTAQNAGRYFEKGPLDDTIELTGSQATLIRALTVHPQFHAKVVIGGRVFRIVPLDE